MAENQPSRSRRILAGFGLYGLLGLLMVLWAAVAFQLQGTFVYLGLLIIQNPALRPVGWNSNTLVGLSKCGIFILGAIWLGLVPFTEKYLREALEEGRLLVRTGRLLLIIGGIYGVSAGIVYLLS